MNDGVSGDVDPRFENNDYESAPGKQWPTATASLLKKIANNPAREDHLVAWSIGKNEHQAVGSMTSIRSYFDGLQAAIDRLDHDQIAAAVAIVDRVRRRGGTLYTCGNGGSAAIGAHFACDLSKMAHVPGQPRLRALALSDNLPMLTAFAKDDGYDQAFVGQVDGLLSVTDAVFAISTSGRSRNVIEIVEYANRLGVATVALTRVGDNPLHRLAQTTIDITGSCIQVMEDINLAVLHAVSIGVRECADNAAARTTDSQFA